MADKNPDLAQQAEEQYLKILSSQEEETDPSELIGSHSPQCQETLVPPCAELANAAESLSTLQFSRSQEETIQAVVRLSEGSRERVLERLWERSLARLITEEATRVIREAQQAQL